MSTDATANNAAENAEQENSGTPAETSGEQLGEGGLKALQAERQRAADAEKSLKAFTDLGLTVDQIQELQTAQGATPSREQIQAEALKSAETAMSAKLAAVARASEIRAQAVELGFINPADAAAFLAADKVGEIGVTDDGVVDVEKVKALLNEVKTARPYLAKVASTDYRDAGIGRSGPSSSTSATEPGRARLRAAYTTTK